MPPLRTQVETDQPFPIMGGSNEPVLAAVPDLVIPEANSVDPVALAYEAARERGMSPQMLAAAEHAITEVLEASESARISIKGIIQVAFGQSSIPKQQFEHFAAAVGVDPRIRRYERGNFKRVDPAEAQNARMRTPQQALPREDTTTLGRSAPKPKTKDPDAPLTPKELDRAISAIEHDPDIRNARAAQRRKAGRKHYTKRARSTSNGKRYQGGTHGKKESIQETIDRELY